MNKIKKPDRLYTVMHVPYLDSLMKRFHITGTNILIVLSVMVGLATAFGAIGFIWLIRNFNTLFFGMSDQFLTETIGERGIKWWLPLIPMLGGLLVGPIVYKFASEARGHGVPEVMHYLPENVMTLEEVRHIVNWYQTCYDNNTPEKIIKWTMAVCLSGNDDSTESGPVIGWAGVGPVEFDESQTEIFYGLSCEYWGRGFATEAAQAVLEYAFDVIGLKRIVGVANPENAASVKILEKIGLTFEKKLVRLPEKFSNDEGSHFYSKTVQ